MLNVEGIAKLQDELSEAQGATDRFFKSIPVDRFGHTEEPLLSDFSDEARRVSELFTDRLCV